MSIIENVAQIIVKHCSSVADVNFNRRGQDSLIKKISVGLHRELDTQFRARWRNAWNDKDSELRRSVEELFAKLEVDSNNSPKTVIECAKTVLEKKESLIHTNRSKRLDVKSTAASKPKRKLDRHIVVSANEKLKTTSNQAEQNDHSSQTPSTGDSVISDPTESREIAKSKCVPAKEKKTSDISKLSTPRVVTTRSKTRLLNELAEPVCVRTAKSSKSNSVSVTPPTTPITLTRPARLKNLGNTCFMNSILQALFCLKPFTECLSNHSHSKAEEEKEEEIEDEKEQEKGKGEEKKDEKEKGEDEKEKEGGKECLACDLLDFFITMSRVKSVNSLVAPTKIHDFIRDNMLGYEIGHEEDAHEFLAFMRQSISKPMIDLFGIAVDEIKTCRQCGQVFRNSNQLFQDIMLSIPATEKANENITSVKSALQKYFSDQDIDYKCIECDRYTGAKASMIISAAPQLLAITIMRFDNDLNKINSYFALDKYIDFGEFCTESCQISENNNLTYRLQSVVKHIGANLRTGHYIAVGESHNGSIYKMSDDKISKVKSFEEADKDSYILFYVRTDGESAITNSVKSSTRNVKAARAVR